MVAASPPRVALVANAVAFRDPSHGVMGSGWRACADPATRCAPAGQTTGSADLGVERGPLGLGHRDGGSHWLDFESVVRHDVDFGDWGAVILPHGVGFARSRGTTSSGSCSRRRTPAHVARRAPLDLSGHVPRGHVRYQVPDMSPPDMARSPETGIRATSSARRRTGHVRRGHVRYQVPAVSGTDARRGRCSDPRAGRP